MNYKKDQVFDCPYQANQVKDYFVLEEPEIEDTELRREVLQYLNVYVQRLHNSVMGFSSEQYTEYIDEDSWVDFVIVQEISKT